MSFLTRRLIQNFHNIRFIQSKGKYIPREIIDPLDHIANNDVNLVNLLNSEKPLTDQEWNQAREKLFQYDLINEKTIDAAIGNLCIKVNPDAFVSYIQFLKEKNYDINLYVAGRYVSMFESKKSLTDSEKKEISDMYDYVRKKYSVLDVASCERLIRGICLTDRWKESIDLLDMIKMSAEISSPPLTTIIKTAFRLGKTDIGWKYMNYSVKANVPILAEAYDSYIEYCLNTFKDKRELEINILKLFEFLNLSEIIINDRVLKDCLNPLKDLGYTYTRASINHLGRCSNCLNKLPAPVITKEEFDEMSRFFIEKVLVGGNVYYNSTPQEIKKFLEFVKNAKPYDIVIDGLNVAMAARKEKKDAFQRSSRLSKAVEHFVNKNKKILLLGRKHMMKWRNMDYVRHNSKIFLVENSSSDDVHLLYATLFGGMNTCFLSMDLMRKHKFQLPINMQRLFKKWQLSHQYKVDPETGIVKAPVNFELITQNNENGWHIHYHSCKHELAKDSYDATTDWICLQKKENKDVIKK